YRPGRLVDDRSEHDCAPSWSKLPHSAASARPSPAQSKERTGAGSTAQLLENLGNWRSEQKLRLDSVWPKRPGRPGQGVITPKSASYNRSPLAVPTAVFWPCWFWHHTSTTTRVPPPSGRSSFTTPRTVRRSPAYTGCTNATDIVPPLTKPAPSRRVIISETYAVDIIPCASVVRKPF